MAVEAEAALAQKQDAVKSAQESRRATEEKLNEMRARRETVQSEKARLEAEIEALRAFLHGAEGKPLADQLGVEKAYQAALAAALGEGLLASLDSSAKTFWQDLGGFGFLGTAGLPRGAMPLLNHVKDVPAALKRALSHAGIVENFETGERLAQELKPGQILVSLEGDSWRWDGYTQRHDAETPAAARLRHHARLKEAEAALATVQPRVNTAEENFRQADQDYQVAQTGAMQAEAAQQQAFSSLYEARERYAEKARERGEIETRISGLGENLAAARAEETGILGEAENIETQRQALPPLPGLQESLEAARKILAEQRDRLVEVEAAQAGYHGKLESMRARLAHMEESAQSWAARAETGARHLQDLAARLSGLEEEGQALALRPAEIDAERQALLSKSAKAEDNRVMAADALIKAEQKQARLDKEARAAEEALMQAKESRVRFEEQMFRAKSGFDELALRIREHWHGTPEELPAKAGLDTEKLEALEEIEDNLARYNRERENMGPVNLRAEIEADEIQAQIDRITAEKSDLEGAIAKLRQGISTLNREARERLATAFADVDKNFGSLFERLFGGGRAHLKLIESDDPLEAGLEIYASPPGKRLQILSLLSGGEQALTALALLFAIFLVNPSPICVLDEVDAPLDEANVDRFCTLVREMAEQGKTRFLIVTHHRLTMARMDRLFGVTMAEKGVSQLVSVDLKQALALREQGGEGEFETAAA
ncbi:MAG: chromosome partitioning protein ParA, partial [Proteobacteria bacterium]|nr:chromosome partitioning protein ParA [Pseudomonadota bacterium]